MAKKRKLKKGFSIVFIILISLTASVVYYFYEVKEDNILDKIIDEGPSEEEIAKQKEEERVNNINVCYNDSMIEFALSDEYNLKLEELKDYSGTYSIVYTELEDQREIITYNSERIFYGESTVKLPFAIYIYEMALENPSILDKEIYFAESNRVGGSGVMKNMDLTRAYTIRELVKYMVEDSDNIAFFMLIDEFGKTDTKAYWSNLGATTTFVGGDNFGTFSGNDALIYLTKFYEIINSGIAHYDDLIEYSLNAAKSSVMKEVIGLDLYFKYGGPSGAYHELFIVKDEKPYILSVLTEIETLDYTVLLPKIATEVTDLHDMYWNEKMTHCENMYPKEGQDEKQS